ncbi:MAG: amidohydrolase family protein [Balneolaceae bacterium]|nr:amidohydrolase family protein [Balneolaceae bacterium]MCH8547603.1 amidohydrolase family protein [Balneolaceae bacterium]
MTSKAFSRKEFLSSAAWMSAGIAAGKFTSSAEKTTDSEPPVTDKILIKGGYVLTMDEWAEDLLSGDVLIEGDTISDVGKDLDSTDAEVIDASGKIVMPGFVDSHRHMWQGVLRNVLPNGELSDYMRVVTGEARSVFRPDDAYIGNLLSAISALETGVTTVLDWSHIGNSPEHTDSAIRGLRESGIRAVYAAGTGSDTPENRFPDDLLRVREEQIPDNDPLLTLAIGAGINQQQWELARSVNARISVHVNGTGDLLPLADYLGPDVTCIHCCKLLDEEWELLSEKGTGVSISAPVEMIMGHGVPPVMKVLEFGVSTSLSVDVETTVPSNMFTQMRSVLSLQRMLRLNAEELNQKESVELLTSRDVLKYATINGALHNGLDEITGSLNSGKRADLIILNPNQLNTVPLNDLYGAVVNGMDRTNVEMVMVNGEIKKWEGRMRYESMEDLIGRAVESRKGIYDRAGWRER